MKLISIFIAAAIGFSNLCSAQITIDQNDLPSPGDVITRHGADNFQNLDFVATGPNYSWDFSALNVVDSTSEDYFNITQAPFTSLLTFGLFAPNTTKSQIFKNGGNPLNTGTLPGASFLFDVDSTYEFYKKNATRFAKTGYSIRLNGIDVPLGFDSNDVIFNLPVTYGKVDSSHSIFEIDIPFLDFLYYQGDSRRINTVDGWGQLKLPNVATPYDVLRIKSEVYAFDSIHIDTLIINNGFKFNRPTSIEYKWMAKGQKWPILTATATELLGNSTVSNVKYKYTPAVSPFGITDITEMKNVELFPTKIDQGFLLRSTSKEYYSIEIISMDGKIVQNFEKVAGNSFVNTSIQNGLFLVRVINQNGQAKIFKIIK